MNKVRREEIIDYVTYNEKRQKYTQRVKEIKSIRKIHCGKYLTFLFENHDTIWYQIEEKIYTVKIVNESDIIQTINTYNEILGDEGDLACSLLIKIDNGEERNEKLSKWIELPRKTFVKLEDGEEIFATFDPQQMCQDRLFSVQYLKFKTGGRIPVTVGVNMLNFPELDHEIVLTSEQKLALAHDLGIIA